MRSATKKYKAQSGKKACFSEYRGKTSLRRSHLSGYLKEMRAMQVSEQREFQPQWSASTVPSKKSFYFCQCCWHIDNADKFFSEKILFLPASIWSHYSPVHIFDYVTIDNSYQLLNPERDNPNPNFNPNSNYFFNKETKAKKDYYITCLGPHTSVGLPYFIPGLSDSKTML